MNTYDFFLFAGQSNMAGRGISRPQFPEAAPALISGAGVEFRAISDHPHCFQSVNHSDPPKTPRTESTSPT